MSDHIDDLKKKLQKANANLRLSQCLKPGKYRFVIREVKEDYDVKLEYGYLRVRFDCNGQLVSDRFPSGGKVDELLLAVGPGVKDTEDLVGRTGELIADPPKNGKVYYHYLPAEK